MGLCLLKRARGNPYSWVQEPPAEGEIAEPVEVVAGGHADNKGGTRKRSQSGQFILVLQNL